jgi:hypothetical protein
MGMSLHQFGEYGTSIGFAKAYREKGRDGGCGERCESVKGIRMRNV